MSRSRYTDDCEDPLAFGRWRAQVKSATRGRRGQAFLRELAELMDSMEEKVLIAGKLINEDGDCCPIGLVCKARGVDVSGVDCEDAAQVGATVNIARQLAAEIEYENDEGSFDQELPADRWKRIRKWVESQIRRDK